MIQAEQPSQLIEALKMIAPWVTGGLAGATLTLIVKIYAERRRRKIVSINITKQQFALPPIATQSHLPSEDLTVSYKNQHYKNLSLYTTKIENVGYGGVNNQKLIFVLPRRASLVDQFLTITPASLKYQEEDNTTEEKLEKVYSFDRVEKGDNIVISFLLDYDNLDQVQCLPRGIDDVEYIIGNQEYQNEVEQNLQKLIGFLALFVAVGSLPLIGGMFQSLVLITATPFIVRFASLTTAYKRRPSDHIEIHRIDIEGTTDTTVNLDIAKRV